ncbi:DUF7448 domain-containing protein [Bdellovibrio sp. BCCA]|uniref:DUF7448 domain-containing protein n=1 Tax=Bdellovibrio sp. BCCA TaxID=3136281 RepID=UPI0030F36BD4
MNKEKNLNVDLSFLLGKTIISHKLVDQKSNLLLVGDDGMHYWLGGFSSDGGHVHLEDINGNLDDLLNSPILRAEEKTVLVPEDQKTHPGYTEDYYFYYEISTIKGSVHMRFYGEEGAYYSASAWFYYCIPQMESTHEKH